MILKIHPYFVVRKNQIQKQFLTQSFNQSVKKK